MEQKTDMKRPEFSLRLELSEGHFGPSLSFAWVAGGCSQSGPGEPTWEAVMEQGSPKSFILAVQSSYSTSLSSSLTHNPKHRSDLD